MLIKEEHYHLRSMHTQDKKDEEEETSIRGLFVPFDYKTHTHAEREREKTSKKNESLS